MAATGGVARRCLYCVGLFLGFSCVVAQDSQQPVYVVPTLVPPLDNASLTWTTTESLLLTSLSNIKQAEMLWGPVVVPPWMAFVSASIPCDRLSEQVFFTEDKSNYSEAVFYNPKHSIRIEDPLLNTVKGVYTAMACIMACIQSKNFTCKSVDYFWKDGGRCGLYDFKGQTGDYFKPYYSTTADGSDHYDLLVDGNCSRDGVPYRSHNFATIAWQAFAIGWFELAAYEFDKAIGTGEKPLTAYLGRTLCNDDFGFSGANGSYKEDILETNDSTDMVLRLSKQENLYFRALAQLLTASNLTQGSNKFAVTMNEVADASVDKTVVDQKQYALGLTLRGVALLNVNLSLGISDLVKRVLSPDMTAMAYVTKRFDPYNNGPEVLPYFDSAVQAATTFQVTYNSQKGLLCANLIRSSVNVLEAYGKWTKAALMATAFSNDNWLKLLVIENLLVVNDGTYYLKEIGLVFTSRDEQVILYERAHFQYLQAGSFSAATELATYIQNNFASNNSFERAIIYRVLANAYYSSTGSIYDSYAANVTFSNVAVTEKAHDDLMKWSVGYHQLARYLQNTSSADGAATSTAYSVLERLLTGFINATTPRSVYSTALSMLLSIAKSRERESNGKMQEAIEAGRKASELQALLANVTFAQGTKTVRQLLPIAHVYYGQLLKRAYDSQSMANKTGLVDAQEAALLSAALWLPRNTSTSLLYLGKLYASAELYRPEIALDYLHTLTNAWNSSGTTGRSGGGFPGYFDAVALEHLLASPDPGPCAGIFNVSVGCFGFWILIAIAIAAVLIIGATVLVLCCRRRIRRPVKDKENASDFVFKGPQDFLTPDTNTLSSLYRYGNVGSARSLDSSTHELADAYNQEANGYYKPSGSTTVPTDAPDTAATPSAEYSNATFAPTTLERSKYERVKRRDAPQADVPEVYFAAPAGSATTLERGFNVPKDFE